MSDEVARKWRVPALEQRYPPGCPDADWCAGNGVCYWDCCQQIPDPDEAYGRMRDDRERGW